MSAFANIVQADVATFLAIVQHVTAVQIPQLRPQARAAYNAWIRNLELYLTGTLRFISVVDMHRVSFADFAKSDFDSIKVELEALGHQVCDWISGHSLELVSLFRISPDFSRADIRFPQKSLSLAISLTHNRLQNLW
jgi:hypothetical protein